MPEAGGTLRSAKDGCCAVCFKKATNTCGKCKQRWYCCASHQAKDWNLGHKGDCGLADLPRAVAPKPPPERLPESVERPVVTEAVWRRLLETTESEPRSGPPRGLRNIGNSCYMNAVLQGLHYAAPMLSGACQEHRAAGCRNTAAGACFRCDVHAVAAGYLDPRPIDQEASADDTSLRLDRGDRVALHGLEREELNGLEGVVLEPFHSAVSSACAAADVEDNEARCSVQLLGQSGAKAIKATNLALRSRAPGAPTEVARWLPKLGEEFTFGAQEDAHEFLRSLLRMMEDEELKEHATSSSRSAAADQASSAEPVREANADLTATPQRLFGGLQVSQCQCTKKECSASGFTFEPFMDLSLDITEHIDSIEDALALYTAPERLDKKNCWKCSTCGESSRARKQLMIYSQPRCLVLHLKRFRFGERGKVTKAVDFSSVLNLRPYLCAAASDEKERRPVNYQLRAVVVHVDKAGFSSFGHYVAFVRCAPDGANGASKWYLIDDSQSMEVPEAEVLKQQAYILLYAASDGAATVPQAPSLARSRSTGSDSAASVDGAASKCRGREGAVCSFFASSDGLCTKCYKEEHGRLPPTVAASDATPSPTAIPPVVPAAPPAAPGGSAKANSTRKPASDKAKASGEKAKKVGANEPCPCGSGKKFKKCHGAV